MSQMTSLQKAEKHCARRGESLHHPATLRLISKSLSSSNLPFKYLRKAKHNSHSNDCAKLSAATMQIPARR